MRQMLDRKAKDLRLGFGKTSMPVFNFVRKTVAKSLPLPIRG
jgi:hypothetical protein